MATNQSIASVEQTDNQTSVFEKFTDDVKRLQKYLKIGKQTFDKVCDVNKRIADEYNNKLVSKLIDFDKLVNEIGSITDEFERNAQFAETSKTTAIDTRYEQVRYDSDTDVDDALVSDNEIQNENGIDKNNPNDSDTTVQHYKLEDNSVVKNEVKLIATIELDNREQPPIQDASKADEVPDRWKCSKCSKSFRTRQRLLNHRKSHKVLPNTDSTGIYMCLYCGEKFTTDADLCSHIKTHAGNDSVIECDRCFTYLPTKSELRRHKKSCNVGKDIDKSTEQKPEKPGEFVPSNELTEINIKKEARCESDGEENSITLNKPNKSRSKNSTITKDGKRKCNLCGKICLSSSAMYKHVKRQHQKNFKCSSCESAFGFASELEEHARIHTGEKPYNCDQCSLAFPFRQALFQHKRLTHGLKRKCELSDGSDAEKDENTVAMPSDKSEFYCKTCDKGIQSERELRWHQVVHSEMELSYKCHVCDITFETSLLLSDHLKISHDLKIYPVPSMDTISVTEHTGMTNVQQPINENLSSYNQNVFDQPDNIERVNVNDIEPLQCIECSAKFESIKEVAAHYISIHTSNQNHQCSLCYKNFSSRRSLYKHSQGVHRKNLQCDFCDRTFGFAHQLEAHIQNHCAERSFSCDQCDSKFKNEKALGQHRKRHLELKTFECTQCKRRFGSKANLDQHIQRKHNESKSLACSVCDKKFFEEKELKWHMFRHTGVSDYQCHVCGKYLCAPHSLRKHLRVMHPDPNCPDKVEFNCNVCNELLENQETVKEHEELHNSDMFDLPDGTSKTWLDCRKCNSSFASPEDLMTHVREVHVRTYICDTCGKLCVSKKSLYSHVKRMHEKMFKCDECEKSFGFLPELESHKRIHTGVRPYMCDQCDKSFCTSQSLNQHKKVHTENSHQCEHCGLKCGTPQHLKVHILRKHSKDRPFKCKECPKGFVTARELSWHEFTHTGTSEYFCEICHKFFSAQNVLDKHIKSVHYGIKQLCPICGKYISSGLKIHMKAHTEKQYKCGQCDKSYAWGHLLKEHERTHTGERPYTCHICSKTFVGSANFTKHKKSHEQPALENTMQQTLPQLHQFSVLY